MATARFVWFDLMTTDPARARDFYTRLAGWKVEPHGPEYLMISAGEQGVGGMVKLDAGQGVPSHWIGYVSVPDIDASTRKVTELGGHVHVPPTAIPNVGRFAVVADRQGATFSLLQLDRDDGGAPSFAPGQFVWNELQTSDPADAATFYADLLGWTYGTFDAGGEPYWLVGGGEKHFAGIMRAQGEFPPLWLPYLHVPGGVDAGTANAKALGAHELVPPMPIPGTGRFSILQDPTGAAVALFEYEAGKEPKA